MKINSILEAQLADKPDVSFARLKRVAREVQQTLGSDATFNKYESEEDLLVIDFNAVLYISDMEKLNGKFGEPDEFNVPEFKSPWYRWEADGVWIILKLYGGSAQFEILPATTRAQPQDRYLRQRHDEIMDPAAYESVMEAKYFREDDKYKCPDCKGKGGHYVPDGPDDYDVERCDMCNGSGRITHRLVQHLLHDGLYDEKEFKRVNEAKYAEPTTQTLVGEFQFDDRQLDEITMHQRVVAKIKIDPDREPHEENNAILLDNLKFVGGRQLEFAKKMGIKKGLEVGYMRDKHGWMVFGWKTGPGIHSPWSVTGK